MSLYIEQFRRGKKVSKTSVPPLKDVKKPEDAEKEKLKTTDQKTKQQTQETTPKEPTKENQSTEQQTTQQTTQQTSSKPKKEEKPVRTITRGNIQIDLDKYLLNLDDNFETWLSTVDLNNKEKAQVRDAYRDMLDGYDKGELTPKLGSRSYDSTGRRSNATEGFDAYGWAQAYFHDILTRQPEYDPAKKAKKSSYASKYDSSKGGIQSEINRRLFGSSAFNKDFIYQDAVEGNTRGTKNRAKLFSDQLSSMIADIESGDLYSENTDQERDDLINNLRKAQNVLSDGKIDENERMFLSNIGIPVDYYFSTLASLDGEDNQQDTQQNTQETQQDITQETQQAAQESQATPYQQEIMTYAQNEADSQIAIIREINALLKEPKDKIVNRTQFYPNNCFSDFYSKYKRGDNPKFDKQWDEVKIRAKNALLTELSDYENFISAFRSPSKFKTDFFKSDYFKYAYTGKGGKKTQIYNAGSGPAQIRAQYIHIAANQIKTENPNNEVIINSKGDKGIVLTIDEKKKRIILYYPEKCMMFAAKFEQMPRAWKEAYIEQKYPGVLAQLNGMLTQSNKQGGILKKQFGGTITQETSFQDIARQYEQNRKIEEQNKIKESKLSPSEYALQQTRSKKEGGINNFANWDASSQARLVSVGADVISLISAFAPGAGTVTSAASGVAASGLSYFADLKDGEGFWSSTGSFLVNLGLDVLGLVPGLGAGSKTAKIIKNLIRFVPAMLGMKEIISNSNIHASLKKVISDPDNLTVGDWKNVVDAIKIITGLSTNAIRGTQRMAQKKIITANGGKSEKITLKLENGKVAEVGEGAGKIPRSKFDQIVSAKNIEEQNAILHTVAGFENSNLKNQFKRAINPFAKDKAQAPVRQTVYDFSKLNTNRFGSVDRAFSNAWLYDRFKNSTLFNFNLPQLKLNPYLWGVKTPTTGLPSVNIPTTSKPKIHLLPFNPSVKRTIKFDKHGGKLSYNEVINVIKNAKGGRIAKFYVGGETETETEEEKKKKDKSITSDTSSASTVREDWYKDFTPGFDPNTYQIEFGNLENPYFKLSNRTPWGSSGHANHSGMYIPSEDVSSEWVNEVEKDDYYSNKFFELIYDKEKDDFTEFGKRWAESVDKMLPLEKDNKTKSKASFYDENGNLRRSWTPGGINAKGLSPQTYNTLEAYLKHIRLDGLPGPMHNVMRQFLKKYYYIDPETKNRVYVSAEEAKKYKRKLTDSNYDNVNGLYTEEYLLNGELADPNENPNENPDEDNRESNNNGTGSIIDQLTAKFKASGKPNPEPSWWNRIAFGELGLRNYVKLLGHNKAVYNTALKAIRANMEDPEQFQRPTHGRFDVDQKAAAEAADLLNRVRNHQMTTDPTQNFAKMMDAHITGVKNYIIPAKIADNDKILETMNKQLELIHEGIKNRISVANKNRAQLNNANYLRKEALAQKLKADDDARQKYLTEIRQYLNNEYERMAAQYKEENEIFANFEYWQAITAAEQKWKEYEALHKNDPDWENTYMDTPEYKEFVKAQGLASILKENYRLANMRNYFMETYKPYTLNFNSLYKPPTT